MRQSECNKKLTYKPKDTKHKNIESVREKSYN